MPQFTLRPRQFSLLLLLSFLLCSNWLAASWATPQQPGSNNNNAPAAPRPSPSCVSCPPTPTCLQPCRDGKVCVVTAQSCTQCAQAFCQESSKKGSDAGAMSADQSSGSNASASPSTIPLAIGGVCAGLVIAAAVAGLVWYRQRRNSRRQEMSHAAAAGSSAMLGPGSSNKSGGGAPSAPYSRDISDHHSNGVKSTRTLSQATGFSIDPRTPNDDQSDRFSMSRPTTAWEAYATPDVGHSYAQMHEPTAGPADDLLAAGAPVIITSQEVPQAYDATVDYTYVSIQAPGMPETPSIVSLTPPQLSLSALVMAATTAVSDQYDNKHDRHLSVAESVQSDVSAGDIVTVARKTTIRSAQTATVVNNVEVLRTPASHQLQYNNSQSNLNSPAPYTPLYPNESTHRAPVDSIFIDNNGHGLSTSEGNYHLPMPTDYATAISQHSLSSQHSIATPQGPPYQLRNASGPSHMRPESELDPGNNSSVLDDSFHETVPESPQYSPTSMMDITIQLPDSIRDALKENGVHAGETAAGVDGQVDEDDPDYWTWREQILDSHQ